MPSTLDGHNVLRKLLTELKATGEDGFEGLLRDATSGLAGRWLSLAKQGGPQGGSDMATDPLDGGPGIAVEAKRFDLARLKLDALKAKIGEAVERRPDLDVMVFGATCEISRDDQDSLQRSASEHGVSVLFIDWPRSSARPPPLAVLCALAPSALLDRLSGRDRTRARAQLERVRSHAAFGEVEHELRRTLARPDMGWTSARERVAEWLGQALGSKLHARAHLKGHLNLLDPAATPIDRPRVFEQLDAWWTATPRSPLLLLGEEGVGKSWASLAWWLKRRTDLPLSLWIPASSFQKNDELSRVVARALAQQTGVRDEPFWRRKLSLWLRGEFPTVRLLLILDGLNENWDFDGWDHVLAQLASPPWSLAVATLLTCRPDHWNQHLAQLDRLLPHLEKHTVQRLDDFELDSLLAKNALTRASFGSDILPLLRVPRLSALAIRHHAALEESGDVTPERLIYEDWKHRLEHRGLSILNDESFQRFIVKIGEALLARARASESLELTLDRGQLRDRLGAQGGRRPEDVYAALSEVVDGRWVQPAGRGRLRIDPTLTPFALGAALFSHLLYLPEARYEDELAKFLDPLGGLDRAASILRAATTIALVDQDSTARLRRTLLGAWCMQQNFGDGDFDAFWRLISVRVESFIEVAEDIWERRAGLYGVDEILIQGFAEAGDRYRAVAARVVGWSADWLGAYVEDPFADEGQGSPVEGEASRRVQATRARREAWDRVAAILSPSVPVRIDRSGAASRIHTPAHCHPLAPIFDLCCQRAHLVGGQPRHRGRACP